ncbi:hypothetical protein ACW23B_27435 [Streptomyces albidoflavus]
MVQTIARRLAAALGERPELSLRVLAAQSDVGRQTIGDLLAGAGWPDVLTVCGWSALWALPSGPDRIDSYGAHD